MSETGAPPLVGEIIWTDFNPILGREQAGRRPALVISVTAFNAATQFAVVCPITSRIRPFPSSVVLPPDFPLTGEILISHLRSIDLLARPVRSTGVLAPPATLDQVGTKLRALFGL